MRDRLTGLGAALFGLVQVLGTFAGLRPDGGEGFLLTLFYGATWVCGLHGLFGTEPRRRAPRA